MDRHLSGDRAETQRTEEAGRPIASAPRLGVRELFGLKPLLLTGACVLVACGSSNWGSATLEDGGTGGSSGGAGSSGGGASSSSGGKGSSSGGKSGSSGAGSSSGSQPEPDGGGPPVPPPEDGGPTICNPSTTDSPATPLTFTNNLIASPAPPGNLTPANAPQIIVVGWDDVESLAGVQFVSSLLGSVANPATNPNSMNANATANLNANACYAGDALYACGDGTLASDRSVVTDLVTTNGWTMANHTLDHLEPTSGWTGIPAQWLNPPVAPATVGVGWQTCPGPASTVCSGPGCCLDATTWGSILPINGNELNTDYGVPLASILGFRAPRLEMNDVGLNALANLNYQYDSSLEEIQPQGYVNAAVDANTAGGQGFNWFPWPYTLDNGSPGIWNQQATGSQQWITNFPMGLWETPTYEVYVPTAGGLGLTIANRMLVADKACTFPPGTPADQEQDCFLSPGELVPGQAETEITGFDFNTFIYCLMKEDEWLTTMEHTFLLRYYGSRTPLTYGSHPIEYTEPYDSYTLGDPTCTPDTPANPCPYTPGNTTCCQANNYGYRDVTEYNTYMDRQAAMMAFVAWIKADPNFSKDTYFMSAQDLVNYMQNPFDKTGTPVQPDTVASPDSNGLFSRLGFTASTGATFNATSGNSATITFTLPPLDSDGDLPDVLYVEAGLAPGALQGVSHIDIKYNTQIPFRIRLLTSDGSTTVTSLLAGVGGDRTARIRIKDFFPGPEAAESQVDTMSLVDSSYMAKVTGIAFESAATTAAPSGVPGNFPGGTFTTTIEQITLHGVATASLCTP